MAEITDNPMILDLSPSYGTFLIGIYLSCILWGVSSLQAFLYFSRYWDVDSRKRKALVAFVWVVDSANQGLVMSSVWSTFIKKYGSIVETTHIQPAITHHSWVAQIVAFSVQLFFIHRLWIFSHKNYWFAIPMFLLSLFQLVVIIPYNIIVISEGNATSQISAHWATSVVMALRSCTAGEDVILAAGMILLVLKDGMPEYRATRRMFSRLIFLAANTGFWTAAVALIEVSLVAAFPDGTQFLIAELPLANIYVNTLLANLNARDYVRGDNFTDYNSTPSWLASSRTTSNGETAVSGVNVFKLGGKSSSSPPDSTPMVRIETSKISDGKNSSFQTQSPYHGDHAV